MVHSLSPLFVLTCLFIWIGLSFVVLFRYNHLTRGSSWWMVGVFSGKMMITMVPYSNLFFFFFVDFMALLEAISTWDCATSVLH